MNRKVPLLTLVLLFIVTFLSAASAETVLQKDVSEIESTEKFHIYDSLRDKYEDRAKRDGDFVLLSLKIENQRTENERNLTNLQKTINNQKDEIHSLKLLILNIKNDEKVSFAEWSGILLASVAIILTVLGLVIAVFSFFGYKKMINSAEETARIKAEEIILSKIHETTESELIKLFEGNKLDQVLTNAAAKVIYRGIGRPSDSYLNSNEEETDNL